MRLLVKPDRVVTTRPAERRISARGISGDELLPVMGSSLFVAFTFFSPDAMTFPAGEVVAVGAIVVVVAVVFTAAGAIVVVELTTGAGATGDPVSTFEVSESPIPFTALMVTE